MSNFCPDLDSITGCFGPWLHGLSTSPELHFVFLFHYLYLLFIHPKHSFKVCFPQMPYTSVQLSYVSLKSQCSCQREGRTENHLEKARNKKHEISITMLCLSLSCLIGEAVGENVEQADWLSAACIVQSHFQMMQKKQFGKN